MRYIVPVVLFLVGLIHILPLAGVLGGARLHALYGIAVSEPNLEILLRHRAVLFGLLGLFLCIAAFRPAHQAAALLAGLASVASFLFLAAAVGGYNAHLARVFAVDVAALVLLVLAGGVFLYAKGRA
ncbi:MAG TPA: phosphopantetheine adenylyltransferase [Variovorax sp.]